jgi:hypothetical protein
MLEIYIIVNLLFLSLKPLTVKYDHILLSVLLVLLGVFTGTDGVATLTV